MNAVHVNILVAGNVKILVLPGGYEDFIQKRIVTVYYRHHLHLHD